MMMMVNDDDGVGTNYWTILHLINSQLHMEEVVNVMLVVFYLMVLFLYVQLP